MASLVVDVSALVMQVLGSPAGKMLDLYLSYDGLDLSEGVFGIEGRIVVTPQALFHILLQRSVTT